MNEELVSVIMPTYNSGEYVAASIESIINQSYKKWELLVTDDGSTDNTRQIVESYARKDGRIRLFSLQGNNGSGVARNNSIKEAQGRYIAFCDSDDLWLPEKLKKQIAFMQRRDCCFSFSSYYVCDAEGHRTGIIMAPPQVSLIDTKRDNKIGFLTAVYDTQKYGKIYMPDIRKRQDWAYGLTVLKNCGHAYSLKEPLACYRDTPGSISSAKLSLIRYNAKVYSIVFGYSALRSYCYLFALFMPTYAIKNLRNWLTNIRFAKKKRRERSKPN